MTDLMSTREVARYLGVNEKKVYFLAKAGKIPCTRVTGKWTFPKKLIDQWIEESASGLLKTKSKSKERSFLLAAGSDDPSLGILRDLFEQKTQPASFFMGTSGSSGGLAAVQSGAVDVATSHLLDPASGEYNLPFMPAKAVAVQLFYRDLGLVVPKGNSKEIRSMTDLRRRDVRVINRQRGSGTRAYLDHEIARLKIDPKKISGYGTAVSTHLEVGLHVLRGEADVGLATKTTALLLGLGFVSLRRERFDLLILKDRFFAPSIQILMDIIGSGEFRDRVHAMGGYDVSESGRVISSKHH
jgi:putative molybdopterin biosynthesis protein